MPNYTSLAWLITAFVFISENPGSACTTAIICGKGTPDGRPLLYKHRDSGFYQNKLMYFEDGKYAFIAVVNSEDEDGKELWAGAHNAGFAIMNSASYNLNINDTTSLKDQEGIIMKEALASCATLKEFEGLLRSWPKPMGIEANFGVIDADGGAAYYETTNFRFNKIDVNDPAVAPFGYVIRTNYSFITASPDEGYGYIRYLTAAELFYQAAASNRLDFSFLLQKVSRSLRHSLLDIDLEDKSLKQPHQDQFFAFEDYIPRYTSVTTTVVQGISKKEKADLTTIWTILGFPLTSVAYPCWVGAGSKLPGLVSAAASENAPLCNMALELKKRCYPITRGSGKKYINLTALLNNKNSGIMQSLRPVENSVIQMGLEKLNTWRESGFNKNDAQNLYADLDQFILSSYRKLFNF
jgi:hypothetical protein